MQISIKISISVLFSVAAWAQPSGFFGSNKPPVQLAAPTFSPPAGSYSSTQTVTITYPGGSTGCYATSNLSQGGTAGTCGAGWTTYTTTVSVSTTETLYAYATQVGQTNSNTSNAAYTISGPATTFVQQQYCQGSLGVATLNCSFGSTPTVGDTILVIPAAQNQTSGAAITFGTPTDNQTGNSYSSLVTQSLGFANFQLFGSIVSGSTGTFTVTATTNTSTGTSLFAVTMIEYANGPILTVDAASSVVNDGCQTVTNGCALGSVSGVTTTNAADLVLAISALDSGNGNTCLAGNVAFGSTCASVSSTWNFRQPTASTSQSQWKEAVYDQIVSSTGTFNPYLACTPSFNCPATPGAAGTSVVVALKQH